MGIRVDEDALRRASFPLQVARIVPSLISRNLLNGELPHTVGGGIGQSRICMFYLRKAHIGEVQSSIWPSEVAEEAATGGIQLLSFLVELSSGCRVRFCSGLEMRH